MVDQFMRNRIIENVRKLLDEGFQDIRIKTNGTGFTIMPTKIYSESTKSKSYRKAKEALKKLRSKNWNES